MLFRSPPPSGASETPEVAPVETTSVISVEVIGYGGDTDEEEDKDKKKQEEESDAPPSGDVQ